eukprot:1049141-Pleurochrysis_carterae.AAC.1
MRKVPQWQKRANAFGGRGGRSGGFEGWGKMARSETGRARQCKVLRRGAARHLRVGVSDGEVELGGTREDAIGVATRERLEQRTLLRRRHTAAAAAAAAAAIVAACGLVRLARECACLAARQDEDALP